MDTTELSSLTASSKTSLFGDFLCSKIAEEKSFIPDFELDSSVWCDIAENEVSVCPRWVKVAKNNGLNEDNTDRSNQVLRWTPVLWNFFLVGKRWGRNCGQGKG